MPNKTELSPYAPVNNACLMILAATALTWILIYAKTVLMPFIIAVFISMVFNTLADSMKKKWNVPRVVGLLTALLLFMALAGLSVAFISNSISSFADGANIYTEKLNDTLQWAAVTAQKFGVKANSDLLTETFNRLPVLNMVRTMGSGVVSLLTNISLVTLFLIFIFMGRATEKTTLVGSIEKQISYYLIVKIIVSLLAAVLVWIALTVIHTELAMMFAVLTFVLNFIPNIGPFIATLLPMPVLFLQYGFDWRIILAACLLTAIHFVIGNVLETKWLGKGMDLNPVVVIASLIFWALVWGPVGALLAVPLTAIVKMILERSEPTKPFAELLAGRMPFK